jgi:hypothetical protein
MKDSCAYCDYNESLIFLDLTSMVSSNHLIEVEMEVPEDQKSHIVKEV